MAADVFEVAEVCRIGVPGSGMTSVPRPCLPSSLNTGSAATAARNSPLGSYQPSLVPVCSRTGRGAISATSMWASTGNSLTRSAELARSWRRTDRGSAWAR